MKFYCCGDSFFVEDNLWGNNIGQYVAENLNTKVVNYAKLGASNFTIRLQVERAIQNQADLIIIGFTSIDRIEIPFSKYRLDDGIENIDYTDNTTLPEFYRYTRISTKSDVISNFKQTDYLKSYLANMYDPDLKRQMDYFVVTGLLDKLVKTKIPFIFTRGGLTGMDYSDWQKYEVPYQSGCPWLHIGPGPKYHTTVETQKMLSNIWLNKILELYTFS